MNLRNGKVARCLVKERIVCGIAALLLVACGGGGADGEGGIGGGGVGGGSCPASATGRSQPLACSTNGLSPDALDEFGKLSGLYFQETSPADLATGVAVTAVVRVMFTKAMVTAPSIVVRDPVGRVVTGRVVVNGANVLFTPDVPLSPTETYTVVVDGGLSVDGDAACGFAGLAGRCHLEFSFTTS